MLNLSLLVFAILVNLILGLFVFSKNPNSKTHRYFLFLTTSTAAWLGVNHLSSTTEPNMALVYMRLVMVTAIMQSISFYLLALAFPNLQLSIKPRAFYRYYFWATVAIAICISPYLFTGVSIENGKISPIPGPGFLIFLPTALCFIISGIWQLFHKNRTLKKEQRAQIRILLMGFIFLFGCIIIFNLLLPIAFKINIGIGLSPIYVAIFSIITAYAILTHHLFDIRVIVKRTIVYSGLLLVTFIVYNLSIFILSTLIDSKEPFTLKTAIINLIPAFFIAIGLNPIENWLQNKTDKFLFKKDYEHESVIKELTQKLNNVIALDEALEAVMQTMVKVLHLHHSATYVFQQGENGKSVIKRVKQIGYRSTKNLILDNEELVVDYFNENHEILQATELKNRVNLLKNKRKINPEETRDLGLKETVLDKLTDLSIDIALPLFIDEKLVGLIMFSEKMSQDSFSAEDIKLIELVGTQAISSIQKAKLYEGDQMKTEFVSIASHELLTPISAMEGYLSMIIDENIGHVDQQAKEYLNKVYVSAKRLSVLIKDLLSVSRIESGKMKVEPQQLDINELIDLAIDSLKFMAEDKKLKLTHVKPVNPLPPVWTDPDRAMQVITNLISNAIKYTREGSVTILTSRTGHSPYISIEVRDTGIGMSTKQQAHLFEKFYRVDSPETTGIIGTGLGLYITKSILEKMGGTISVKSTPGKGTSFTFTLPIFKVELSSIE